MANEQNLVPLNNRTKTEQRRITQMGGIASGEARRKKKQRGDILREIVNTEVTNEKMLANLKALGIFKEHPTLEDYINATATRDLTKKASMQDVQRLNDEIYPESRKGASFEINGDIKSININVRKYGNEE